MNFPYATWVLVFSYTKRLKLKLDWNIIGSSTVFHWNTVEDPIFDCWDIPIRSTSTYHLTAPLVVSPLPMDVLTALERSKGEERTYRDSLGSMQHVIGLQHQPEPEPVEQGCRDCKNLEPVVIPSREIIREALSSPTLFGIWDHPMSVLWVGRGWKWLLEEKPAHNQ